MDGLLIDLITKVAIGLGGYGAEQVGLNHHILGAGDDELPVS